MAWDTVIGLEVHAQLKTQSKLFSGSATTFGAPSNSQTSYIDAGLPGVLPMLNEEVIVMAITFGIAVEAQINDVSYFERKHYFYPDLPKGYQTSQLQRPIVQHGHLNIPVGDGLFKKIDILRDHLEEDAGKSIHDTSLQCTGIDLNRAGTPLLEIVSAPCLFSAIEAITYLKELHQLLRFLNICYGNMQEGSFRCDVNLSIKPKGAKQLGTRTELKNLNSFRFIEKAIAYEAARHQDLLERNQPILQETRLFCPATETTQRMRSKENEYDYRYFPDPDLLPVAIPRSMLMKIKETMPPLPQQLRQLLEEKTNLSEEDRQFLLSSPAIYQFYCEVAKECKAEEKIIVNWLKGHYCAALHTHQQTFENPGVSAKNLATLLNHLHDQSVTTSLARKVFSQLWISDMSIEDIVAQEQSTTSSNEEIEMVITNIIHSNPKLANEYREGKEKLLAFFIGQVMKETKGQANPEVITQLLKKYLLE